MERDADLRWSRERAWQWYNARPWFRGCNYVSADCTNRVDQWQSLGFEERFQTTEQEFRLLRETGFNSVRLIPEYVVWKEEHDGFLERFERYIALCAKYGISCMIVLANDCMPPKTEYWKKPFLGEQEYVPGYMMNRKHSQHGHHTGPAPHFYLDEPESRDDYFRMVEEVVTRYRDDERICVWDLYNEPGNSRRGEITLPNLVRMFETVRGIDPIQPLTTAVWTYVPDDDAPLPVCEQYAIDHSDIITYHHYGPYDEQVRFIRRLKREGRPIMNTEWLARCLGCDVFSMFPLFYLEKIGCYNWGFVNGRQQCHEPWQMLWEDYEAGTRSVDFTKWFHDLYRPSHRPYDPAEIRLIKDYCRMADEDWGRK